MASSGDQELDNCAQDLSHPCADVRITCARALGNKARNAEVSDADALLSALEHDTDEHVVRAVAQALVQINTSRAVSPLRKALDKWQHQDVGRDILAAIRFCEDEEMRKWIATARNAFRTSILRERALRHLVERNIPEAYDIAIDALADPEPGMRVVAVATLASIGNTMAIDHLKPLLHDADADVRLQTAAALIVLGDHTSVDFLLTLLKHHYHVYRVGALNIFTQVWEYLPNRDISPVIHALHDTHAAVRQTAATHLASLSGVENAQYLIPLLCDRNDEVVYAAADSLTAMHQMPLRNILEMEMHSSDQAIRHSALKAERCIQKRFARA